MTIGFAHRGARLEHRDNTLAGFARALELGADGLESDAWLTADGVVVLDHDGVVRRGVRRTPIAEVPRSDLPGYVPDLGQLLELAGAVEVSLDVKDPAAAPVILAAAGRARSRTWLCSPDVDALGAWRGADAVVRLVHSTSLRRIGGVWALANHAAGLEALGVDAVNLRAAEWDRAAVAACHSSGLHAFAWDAQLGSTLRRLVSIGIDAVYSDHVGRMVAVLGRSPEPVGPGSPGRSEDVEVVHRPDPDDRPADDEVAGDGTDVA